MTWGYETGLAGTVEIDETESIDGARSLRILPKGETNWYFIVLYQTIPLTVGKDYTASFWVKAEAPRPLTAKFKATDNTIDWGQTDFQATTEWAEYAMTSKALNASVKLEIFCSGVEIPFWLDFVNVYEGEYVPGLEPSGAASPEKAGHPNPADGAVVEKTWTDLTWRAGSMAASHRVYFGEDFDAISQGQGEPISTTVASVTVGKTPPYAAGLTPGQVYYWRVDEVNDANPDSPWRGDVWSFRVRPLTAWDPSPADGILYVDPDQDLTWKHGMGNLFHTVYFGDNFESIKAAQGVG